jgi:hypothetical protein
MPFVNLSLFVLICTAFLAVAEDAVEEGNQDIDIPIPVGIPMNGLKIPCYDEEGNVTTLLESDIATKIDERMIEFANLKIEVLDNEGRKIFVELPQSLFNLETRILSGQQSAKIRRDDFEINGDSIEFDTRTKFGRIRGNITMIITSENNEK